MSDTLTHRGPDDSGVWIDESGGVGLGFRRLAIVDLSPSGHQPMRSPCHRFVILFNGEVYNYLALRKNLEQRGHAFRGHSDTEVVLAAISEWGLEKGVEQFIGMFAFALWDNQEHILHLVRDRLGIKPLYYGRLGSTFVFASELKALQAYPGFQREINRHALALFMRHGYIPAPYSIYNNIHKLPPGMILRIGPTTYQDNAVPYPYWSVRDTVEKGLANPFEGSENEAVNELDRLLADAVRLRMIADVPLGAFLSGGIDSSTVVALMQSQSTQAIKTYSIGFTEQNHNEAEYAKAVAHHLGTEHTELYITPEEAMRVIPKLPTMYDEPFADSSQIPTFLVSQLARCYVTVSLSGDGGDELFAGYHNYFTAQDIWSKIKWLPLSLRMYLSSLMIAISPDVYNRSFDRLTFLGARSGRAGHIGDKLHKLAGVINTDQAEALYYRLISNWTSPTNLVKGSQEPPTAFTQPNRWPTLHHLTEKMMFLDTVSYLPDDILTKLDRASMAVSLEARVPLLDHRIVEFAWRLPLSMKIKNKQGKWLLRQVLYKYVPPELVERPKMGFGIPLDSWLRGPLREWAEELLDESRLQQEGFLEASLVRTKWQEHLSGKHNWASQLWNVLVFQSWLENYREI